MEQLDFLPVVAEAVVLDSAVDGAVEASRVVGGLVVIGVVVGLAINKNKLHVKTSLGKLTFVGIL